jgi:hypothetical protein
MPETAEEISQKPEIRKGLVRALKRSRGLERREPERHGREGRMSGSE